MDSVNTSPATDDTSRQSATHRGATQRGATQRGATQRGAGSGGWLALILLGLLGAVFLLERVQRSSGLQLAFGGAIALLGAWVVGLRVTGRPLAVERWLRTPHYVQAGVQLGVYGYWALYWPQVAAQAPLILAQVVFLMLFEACISWSLGRRYRLGFSAVPIIGSLNLFLWFRDEAFAWQLVLVALAYLSKEFVKWERGGRRVHIFNPSAIVLALAGLVMIVTQTAHHAWAAEISTALGRPPFAYENIFLMGLVVLSFVPSVLVTISATLTLLGLGRIYFEVTGTWRFVDTGIPIAVWLGMTLLATDPASTPRRRPGKIVFGVLYGASVFVIYGLLRGLERPPGPDDPGLHVSYFDKLLFLPVLNLSVRWIDRLGAVIERSLDRVWPAILRNPKVHLVIWVGVFLLIRGRLTDHPGRDLAFWEAACAEQTAGACAVLRERYTHDCERLQIGEACHNAATMTGDNPARAATLFTAGCTHGVARACLQASQRTADPIDGQHLLTRACTLGDASGCDELVRYGMSVLQRDALATRAALDAACGQAHGVACANLAVLLQRGAHGVAPDPARAQALRKQACDLGVRRACGWR